jgi:sugar/nucleoside kinase (ribokinase family)
VSVELAVVGNAFLDLTFEGLPRLPSPGEEILGRALHVNPGGAGMQAVAAARLGLSVALVGRIGDDAGGQLLREVFAAEGVRLIGRPGSVTATTALLETPGGVAMATVQSDERPTAEDVAGSGSSVFVAPLGALHLIPPPARVYAVTGALELPDAGEAFLRSGRRVHALIANRAEAAVLTGLEDPEQAAVRLSGVAETAVVTMAADGVVGSSRGSVIRTPAKRFLEIDATGAGDLFAAAYVWADLRGAGLRDRLSWAALYAGFSVRHPTAMAGALRLPAFLAGGRSRGLNPP